MAYGISEYPNTFKRQDSFPLDMYSNFKSYEEALNYANYHKASYAGQIITVIENDIVSVYYLQKSADSDKRFDLVSNTQSASSNNVGTWTGAIIDDSVLFTYDLQLPLNINYIKINNVPYMFTEDIHMTKDLLVNGAEFIFGTTKYENNEIIYNDIINVSISVLKETNNLIIGTFNLV